MAPPSLTHVPPAAFTAIMQPGDALWDEAVKRLLGFHDSTYAAAAEHGLGLLGGSTAPVQLAAAAAGAQTGGTLEGPLQLQCQKTRALTVLPRC